MNKYLILLALLLLPITTAAVGYGENDYGVSWQPTPIEFNNNTAFVNASENWITDIGTLGTVNSAHFNNIGGTLTIDESHFDLLYCQLTGCTMSGDIDMSGNDINNVGDITASSFIGDGSQLTGTMNYTNIALTNQSNLFNSEEGATKIANFNNKDNPFDTSGRSIDVSSYHLSSSPHVGNHEGIGGFNVIGGGNYSDGSKATALAFGNVALTEAYQGLGAGGNESLDVYGLNIYGADGISHWASGVDGIFSMRDVYGMDLISARKQSRVYGNIYNTMLRASTTTEAVDGNETILTLEKPTKGVNNWQMILEGTGTGTGIWFGGTGGERIYSDGTNLNFDTNGNLAYFSNNISATGFITRTSLLSADTIAQDWIKDTEDYKNEDGSIKHSAFKGYTEFQVTDFNKSEINQWKEEQCLTIPIINEEYCKIVDMEEITYPYTKIEKGVDLQTEQNVLRQGLYEALERIKYLEDNCQMKLVTK